MEESSKEYLTSCPCAMSENSAKLPVLVRFLPVYIKRRIVNRPHLVKILDNIGWLFFDKILRMGVGLIVGVWVARYLGPEQFGVFNFAQAFVGLFGAIAGLGLQGIVVRDLVREPSGKEEILGTAAAMQFVGGLLAYGLIMSCICWLRPDDALARVIVAILGSMMLFKASEVAVYWLESQVLSKYTVWVQNVVFLVFAVIKVVLILRGFPLIAFAWVTMFEALIVAFLMMIVLGLCGPRLRRFRITVARAKALLEDCWPLLLSGIAVVIYMRIDQVMLGQMIGDEAVGVYSAAARVSEIWYFVPMTIVTSVFPAILKAKNRDEVQYYNRMQMLYNLMTFMSIVVALPMTFFSNNVLVLLFGYKYAEAGPVLAVHIWAAVFVFLGVASDKWFLVENRQSLMLQRTVLGASVNVILNFLLIPAFGPIGAAYATVAANGIAAYLFDVANKSTRRMFIMKTKSFDLRSIFKQRY